MFKVNYVLCFAVLLLIPNNNAQSNNKGDELLYSQTGFPENYVSLPSYINDNGIWSQVADDFTTTTDWTINRIILMGPDIDNSIAGFNINIYADNNRIPGALIYSAEGQPYTHNNFITYTMDQITIALQTPISLNAGNYWISVQGKTNFHWNQISESFGKKAVVRSNGFGWAPIGGFYESPTDMYFEFYGSTLTSVESNIDQPVKFALSQNYPNPFNPSTVISYQLPVSSDVTLKVYDVLGNEVASLVNEEKPEGNYEIDFDAKNLSSGIFLYTLQAGNFSNTKKMIFLK